MAAAFSAVESPLRLQATLFAVGADDKPVGGAGQRMEVRWAPLAGATAARPASPAVIRIGPPEATESVPQLPIADAGGWLRVDIPPNRAVYALTCTGLTAPPSGTALVVAVLVGSRRTPVAALGGPSNPAAGVLPGPLLPQLQLDNGLLRLPAPAVASRVLLAFVTGDVFTSGAVSKPPVTRVDALVSRACGALKLTGPDGGQLWSRTPAPLTDPEAIDVTDALRNGLDASLSAPGGPAAAFTLTGPSSAFAAVRFTPPRGTVVREWPQTLAVDLAGEPVPLPVGQPPLAAEVPQRASVAHVAVRYAGVRLHDSLRDELPAGTEAVAGTVVGAEPVVRVLAPRELEGAPPVRVAVIGRAPEPCTLAVGPADATGTTFAGRPGTLELEAEPRVGVHWVELAGPPEPAAGAPPPATIAVRALAGRFQWADGARGPRVRVAVADPEPGGRLVRLGTATVAAVEAPALEQRDVGLAATALAGGAPALASDLFCRVELTGLTLEYRR